MFIFTDVLDIFPKILAMCPSEIILPDETRHKFSYRYKTVRICLVSKYVHHTLLFVAVD